MIPSKFLPMDAGAAVTEIREMLYSRLRHLNSREKMLADQFKGPTAKSVASALTVNIINEKIFVQDLLDMIERS